jgi:hypothetical protein
MKRSMAMLGLVWVSILLACARKRRPRLSMKKQSMPLNLVGPLDIAE